MPNTNILFIIDNIKTRFRYDFYAEWVAPKIVTMRMPGILVVFTAALLMLYPKMDE